MSGLIQSLGGRLGPDATHQRDRQQSDHYVEGVNCRCDLDPFELTVTVKGPLEMVSRALD